MSSGAYHPQIGSIIRIRDQIYTALYVNQNTLNFLTQCVGLMAILKPYDYSEELEAKIYKELDFFEKNRSVEGKQTRIKRRRRTYTKWFRELNKILWDRKYLENRTYAPETKKDTLFDAKGKEIKKWTETK